MIINEYISRKYSSVTVQHSIKSCLNPHKNEENGEASCRFCFNIIQGIFIIIDVLKGKKKKKGEVKTRIKKQEAI